MNGNLLLSPDALHCLKRKQLINLCRRFGIKAIGKNADLIERLQEYAASNIPTDSPTKGNVPILRHVKRPRQSDESHESAVVDETLPQERSAPLYPPLTPRTRQKRVSDMVAAIEEQMKEQEDQMDTDDEDEDNDVRASRRNTITFPTYSPTPARQPSPLLTASATEGGESTQPLRIIKALPSMNRIASPLSAMTIFESSPTPTPVSTSAEGASSLYPDLSSLPLPQGVSSEGLASSSTLPSITSRQFSAAAATVLAEMNARLTAAGRSAGSLTTMSSLGNGTWSNLAASASSQGMSKSRSGRYEIRHERQFNKMDSIVNHYAARRVGAGIAEKAMDAGKSSNSAPSSSSAVAAAPRLTASASSQRRTRVDASTSTRSLAAMARTTNARKVPTQRRPLPIPPVAQAKLPTIVSNPASHIKSSKARQASTATTGTTTSTDSRGAKRLRVAVSEDQDALQNTVLEIPPEKKSVMIRVTRPEREGMPYKFDVASSSTDGATRAASSLRKTVIKATKGLSGGKTNASAQSQKREAAFVKQQQHQAAVSRSISSRAVAGDTPSSTGTRNKFTGVPTTTPVESRQEMRKPSVAASALSGATEASKQGSISSRFGGSIRSSVSQGLSRADSARQARLKEIKARTKAALNGFASQRNVSASSTIATNSPRKPIPTIHETFSSSVMRPTIASLGRSAGTTGSNGSASLPMLSTIGQPVTRSAVTTLQRAATHAAGVGQILTPSLTPRSSSLRHLRRVLRKQQKQAELEHDRVAAAENIAPGDVVPSVIQQGKYFDKAETSIRAVNSSFGLSRARTMGVRPAGPREALTSSRMTTSALNRM
ncbi:SAP domain protein [Kalmanozyma brasiliensis GHG001]|uniref:SAP domain-containing protein n=1 Tax=Kalmanozyma brasiliensis (strain GHG001) TaxID=1365824 RepID=V5ERD0_KALBG|nr:SAP domain protein [Kalmanozyma brasiliensis GHG001]EST05498.1 SAP domain protein [Kalmanozyma brasiliensis GHG001]